MSTDLVLTKCDRATAKSMADDAYNHDAEWFCKTYGAAWPFKWFSSVIAFFVWERLKWMGSAVQTVEGCKNYITVERIRNRYISSQLPDKLWIGDTTVEMLINTFLVAFIDNGYGTDDDEDEITTETIQGVDYYTIRGEKCRLHLKKPYKGWNIYRAWNLFEGHGKMKYFAVKDGMIKSARNLSGIKDEVSR